ncbi:MAG: hypothetical protein ACKPKO_52320 [Candidatus Fonsibacter sp.]
MSNLITTGNITANKIISKTREPPAGFTDVQIKADQVYFGNPVWLTATSICIFGVVYMLIRVLKYITVYQLGMIHYKLT